MAGNKAKGMRMRKKKVVVKAKEPKPATQREKTVARKRNRAPKGFKMQGLNGGTYSSEADFVKMVMDPCHGPLEYSPFGATQNSYIWRLNYRRTVSSNAQGNIIAALYPNGINNDFGSVASSTPQCNQIWTSGNAWGLTDTVSATSTFDVADYMPGIQALEGVAAQIRVTAGCVKLNYIGPANVAQGQLYAWEGQGDEVFTTTAGATGITNKQTVTGFILNGLTAPVTSGVEARLDYSEAPMSQTNFSDIRVTNTSVFCPVAVVGCSGGPPSTNYVVETTLIVEWTPLLSQGIPVPSARLRVPGAAERVANILKSAAPLLVSVGASPLTGYAGVFNKAVKFGASVYNAMRS